MTSSHGSMPEVGPVGRNLIANVKRLCGEQGLSWNKLSARLEQAGRPVPPLGLSRMAKAGRRMCVDDATALADVLGVTLDVLLAPPDSTPAPEHRALREAHGLAGPIAELLAASGDPEAAALLSGYVDRALRRVQIEVEELLAESGRRDGGAS